MQYMKWIGRTAVLAVGLVGAYSANADGTDARELVVNNVSMTYTVGTTGQTASATVDFMVDRKLRLDVSTPDTDWVTAVPGQVAGDNPNAIAFDVTNNSNDAVSVVFGLIDQAALQVSAPFASTGGNGAFTVNGLTVWVDDGDGILNGSEAALVPASNVYDLGVRTEDEVVRIAVVVDVDALATDELYHTYTLVAAVADTGTPSTVIGNDDSNNASPGGTPVNNTNGEDTEEQVFADAASGSPEDYGFNFLVGQVSTGVVDAASDGQHSNTSGFVIEVALGVAKFVQVIWDPIRGDHYTGVGTGVTTNNPKAIPGALIMYVIGISIEPGSSLTATGVAINDDIDESMVAVGNTGDDATIALPQTVPMTIDGNAVVIDIDEAGIAADKDSIYSQTCADGTLSATTAYAASPGPEVAAISLGTCDATDNTGYVVYFVTVDDSAT